jgi:hypothetical protein
VRSTDADGGHRAEPPRDRVVEGGAAFLVGNSDGVEMDGDGIAYRTMAAYARDVILTRQGRTSGMIAAQVATRRRSSGEGAARAREEDAGEHAVVERRRSHAGAAHQPDLPGDRQVPQPRQRRHTRDLERGTLTYPQSTTSPVVAVQGTEKTEAGQHRDGDLDGHRDREHVPRRR